MKICCVEGCEEPVRARDYCSRHYEHMRRRLKPEAGREAGRRYRERHPNAVKERARKNAETPEWAEYQARYIDALDDTRSDLPHKREETEPDLVKWAKGFQRNG